jgi:hypothetical protein
MFLCSFPQRAKAKPGRPSGGAKKEELVQLARHETSLDDEELKYNYCCIYAALRMFFGAAENQAKFRHY